MRSRVTLIALAALLIVAALTPATAQAKNCGVYMDAKIVTHGGLSCKRAKTVFRKFETGKKLPRGWTCGRSARGCNKGKKSFTFRFV